jgi:hypothetical protein
MLGRRYGLAGVVKRALIFWLVLLTSAFAARAAHAQAVELVSVGNVRQPGVRH